MKTVRNTSQEKYLAHIYRSACWVKFSAEIFFLFVFQKTDCVKAYFLRKIRKRSLICHLSSPELAQRVVKVKYHVNKLSKTDLNLCLAAARHCQLIQNIITIQK